MRLENTSTADKATAKPPEAVTGKNTCIQNTNAASFSQNCGAKKNSKTGEKKNSLIAKKDQLEKSIHILNHLINIHFVQRIRRGNCCRKCRKTAGCRAIRIQIQ